MIDFWLNGIEHLIDRITGPLHFRILLQPLMALIYGVIDGLKHAGAGKPPYFWALFTNSSHRREIVKDGWKSIGKVFLLALILDAGYQIAVLHFVYPGEAIIVAAALAILPYLLVRGPVTRGSREAWNSRGNSESHPFGGGMGRARCVPALPVSWA